VLVISIEEVNQALPIVTIISVTSVKPGRKVYPTEVYLQAENTGLPKESIAMAHQIRAISKDRLREKCGSIEDKDIREQIKSVIKIYLDL
jgi:mRNA interferase MazF